MELEERAGKRHRPVGHVLSRRLRSEPPAALSASILEFVLAFALAGFGGALAQSYRKARPRWLAISVASFVPPAVWHGSEYVVHSLSGTPNLHAGMALSMLYSLVATLTTVTLMRRGLWLSGDEKACLVMKRLRAR